jgi:hypothetical protein
LFDEKCVQAVAASTPESVATNRQPGEAFSAKHRNRGIAQLGNGTI